MGRDGVEICGCCCYCLIVIIVVVQVRLQQQRACRTGPVDARPLARRCLRAPRAAPLFPPSPTRHKAAAPGSAPQCVTVRASPACSAASVSELHCLWHVRNEGVFSSKGEYRWGDARRPGGAGGCATSSPVYAWGGRVAAVVDVGQASRYHAKQAAHQGSQRSLSALTLSTRVRTDDMESTFVVMQLCFECCDCDGDGAMRSNERTDSRTRLLSPDRNGDVAEA